MIVLECNADECLIKTLGFSKKQIAHERCKGEVVKKVGKKAIAIGIIDEDPGSMPPGDLRKYKRESAMGGLTLLIQLKDNNKKLVQISPFLEGWLIKRAKANRIDPGSYKLPSDAHKLHNIRRLDKNRNFLQFLSKLIETDSEMSTLKKWLEESLSEN